MINNIIQFSLKIFQILLIFFWGTILYYRITDEKKIPQIRYSKHSIKEAITIIITGRNEGKNIKKLLDSLKNQYYKNFEVIFVDDASNDNTVSEVEKFLDKFSKIKIIKIKNIANNNWVGKNWACYNGFKASTNNILLFTDADIVYRKETISSALKYFKKNNLEALTLIPKINTKKWSKIILPTLKLIMMTLYSPNQVNNKLNKKAYVYGSFFLINKQAYIKIGTHKAVKNEIVEDKAIGELIKSNQMNLKMVSGNNLINTNWKEGLQENQETLERIISSAIKNNILNGFGFTILAFFTMIFPYLIILNTLNSVLSNNINLDILILIILTSLMLATFGYEIKKLNINLIFILTQPISSLLFIIALISVIKKTIRKEEITWKNRSYKI